MSCRKVSLLAIALAVMLLPAARAEAQSRTHDGFFLQMDLGVGGMASKVDVGRNDVEASGGSGEFSIALGGAVARNLILAGQMWAVAAVDPTVKVDGHEIGDADATITLSGVGVNLTYYTQSNVYFSVTPSLTTLTFESDGDEEKTDTGFGVRLAVGKEWWVSDSWGLGLNGQVAFSTNEDQGETWNTAWVGIAFSATFN
jgi:hypothetical protein